MTFTDHGFLHSRTWGGHPLFAGPKASSSSSSNTITIIAQGFELPTAGTQSYVHGSSSASTSLDGIGNNIADQSADRALSFLEQHQDTEPIDRKKVLRKIDGRLVPIMFLCYTLQYLDKILINYAAVMGMPKELKMSGNDLSNAATAFFISYLIVEIPTGYLLQKFPPAKYLAVNIVLWGLVTACTAAVTNFKGLVAARVLLGAFEASVAPCLTIITSKYYTKREQPARFSLWYCGLGYGQIAGSLLSYGFQSASPHTLSSWRILFLVLGCITVATGTCTFWFLPSTPLSAGFLTTQEVVNTLTNVGGNLTGVESSSRSFRRSHLVEIAKDPQIYLFVLITLLCSVSSGVITTYSATVIRNAGFTPRMAALLGTPSGVVSIVATLVCGLALTGRGGGGRWAWIAGLAIPGAIGGGLMSFLPANNHAGLLMGVYLVNSIVAVLILVLNWVSANVAGHTKRSVSLALVTAAFSVGNILGPQTFQARDAPGYFPAKTAVLATQAGAALVAGALRLYYAWENRRRDLRDERGGVGGAELGVVGTVPELKHDGRLRWMDLTDRENTSFRYVY